VNVRRLHTPSYVSNLDDDPLQVSKTNMVKSAVFQVACSCCESVVTTIKADCDNGKVEKGRTRTTEDVHECTKMQVTCAFSIDPFTWVRTVVRRCTQERCAAVGEGKHLPCGC
jgi:hypothetical protein